LLRREGDVQNGVELYAVGRDARLAVEKIKEADTGDAHRKVGVLEKCLGSQPAIKCLARRRHPSLEGTADPATRTRNLCDDRVARAVLYDEVIINIALFLIVDERSVNYVRGRLVRRQAIGGRRGAGRGPASHGRNGHRRGFGKIYQTRIRIGAHLNRPSFDTAGRTNQ